MFGFLQFMCFLAQTLVFGAVIVCCIATVFVGFAMMFFGGKK